MASNRRIKGITVEIGGDTTKLSSSLESVNRKINSTQSQLKDVERLLKLDPTNTELLAQKQRLLGDAISDTSGRLATLRTASEQAAQTKDNYEAWKAKYDPLQDEIKKTSDHLKDLKAQAEKAQQQLADGDVSQEQYDKLQKEIDETSDKLKTLRQSARDVSDEFGHPVSPEQFDSLQREIVETEQELQRLQTEADNSVSALDKMSAVGEKMQDVGDKISGIGQKLMPVTTVIAGIGTAAVKTGAGFDAEMSNVKAITGAISDDEMPKLLATADAMGLSFEEGADATETAMNIVRAKAREMGAETKFSASEAAQAFGYMAMAGWDAEYMIEGIEGVMYLAAASGEDLALTSDIVTDAMTALGMSADEAGHFADVLASASSNANTNVSLLGESFKYVAPLAGAMGFSAEDLAFELGLMANAGIKGTTAGNSLKNALVNLTKPTKQQADAMRELGLITGEYETVVDSDKVSKAENRVENATATLTAAQARYNDAVTKYGETSTQAISASASLTKAENSLTEAQNDLLEAQEGTVEFVDGYNAAIQDSEGNMRSLKEITDILRQSIGSVNVALTDGEGNVREYEDIIGEVPANVAEQLEYAATLFGKQNLAGMLAIINASEEDYDSLAESIDDCDGTAKNMAETMQDNLNGQLQILKSQLEELAISFSDMLMPTIREIVSFIQGLVDKLNQLSPETKDMILKIALIAAAVAPVLVAVGKIIAVIGTVLTFIPKVVKAIGLVKGAMSAMNLTFLTNPVFLVIAAITALVAAFVYFWNNSEGFRNFWIGLWAEIQETLYGFFDAWRSGWETLKEAFAVLWENIQTILSGFFDAFRSGWESIREFFAGIWESISTAAADAWNTLVSAFEAVYAVFEPLLNALGYLFETIFMAIQILIGRAMDWVSEKITNIWNAIVNFLTPILEAIRSFFETVWNAVSEKISSTMEGVRDIISSIWNAISNFIRPILDGIKTFISSVWDNIKTKVSGVMTAIQTTVTGIWDKVKSAVSEKVNGIRDSIKDGLDQAKEHVLNIAKDAWSWGSDIVNGIIDGIKSKIQDLADGVTSVADTIREYLHFSVPDKGPLTDFESWMPDFMHGLASGIRKNMKYVEAAVEGVAEAMQLTLQTDLGFDGLPMTTPSGAGVVNNYYNTDNSQTFNQTNNSPKSLSRYEVYRQTKNLVSATKR